jgi:hypothetical protein
VKVVHEGGSTWVVSDNFNLSLMYWPTIIAAKVKKQ